MHISTPTLSDVRSENSLSFSGSRNGRRGVDASKFRTQPCRNYRFGAHCSFGSRCAFSHGEKPDLPPPPPYSAAVQNEMVLPPAYASRFRHDPYSFYSVRLED
ncbi:zinc finger protein 1 [Trypanosoma equiperdum]|uniref:Zinc finger protein ZFP1 n=5 Tax=Trypanozoon TaxID=39700 RepID=Q584Y9_TRYB2|nr:zinc finger protein [Trypanosoma brucei gambiense DAL972]XP_845467.1 zinc finger protein ZFP1 [Trypanosoma brucei brucei TREU927]AAL14124.1 ZFP1 [Trypanosoma brucei rhodesiense]AAX79933.1 zinc finger protein ZFP1 [Trypanosoma brucei]RHW72225.1 zinc finger protein 1 [Trypanosoma brucei equiperdum]SCU69441.1 zinc finger protein 1 [Trypanosoma equiperdum]AAZ11908.1 zinc finger protein ZFP1 [Trypanosoma brucei brucei TREU927]|eukprot:XP_011774131.1 zinc finger protein [Trypanosoma brucei gambiense DAL972]